MKKHTSVKNAGKKTQLRNATAKNKSLNSKASQKISPWSLSVYVYWFIIIFFIAATFYILGRSHNMADLKKVTDNVTVIEETLKQSSDYYDAGKEKLIQGNIEEAIIDLTAAINANSANEYALILRGEAHMQSGNYRAALSDFDMAIESDPLSAVAHYDRALLNTRLEDYNAALSDINNALAAQTQKPNAALQQRDLYAKRGQLNLWLKNWEGAIADYANSLARPDGVVSPTVYAERAEAYTALGQYATAIEDYSSAVRVISEQIQGTPSMDDRELLSMQAMTYFEKSAALNLNLGQIDETYSDLTSAYTIAAALNDTESMTRLQGLIESMPKQ